jgi:rare lipoprotein A (peptidoglycan hydrolase)
MRGRASSAAESCALSGASLSFARPNLAQTVLRYLQASLDGLARGQGLRLVRAIVAAGLCLGLAHCSSKPDYGTPSARLVEPGEPVPKGGGVYRVGSPYMVAGRRYVPQANPHYRADGTASWYGADFHGRSTANGEIFDSGSISAAHPTLPLPSYARVTNLSNGRSLIVRVNDRGPYHGGRIIDVSRHAAQLLDFTRSGTAWVRVEYVGPAPISGSDDKVLEATLRQDEPAPSPDAVQLAAATRIVPPAMLLPPPKMSRMATAGTVGSIKAAHGGALAFAAVATTDDDADRLLSGRGLY